MQRVKVLLRSGEDTERVRDAITKEDTHSEDMARSNNNDSSASDSTLPLKDSFSADNESTDDDCGPEFDATAQGKLLLAMIDDKSECIHCGKQVKYMASHLKIVHGPGKPKEIVNCGFCGKDLRKSEFCTHVIFSHSTPSPPQSPSPSPPASDDDDGSTNSDYEVVESSVQEKFEINNNADGVVKPYDTYYNPDSKPDLKLDADVKKCEVVPTDSKNIELKRKYVQVAQSLGIVEEASRKLQFSVGGEVVGEDVQIKSLHDKVKVSMLDS